MKEKQSETRIKCPNCGFEFPVEEALHGHVMDKVKGEYEEKLKQQSKVFSEKQKEIQRELEKKLLEKAGELEEEIRKKELEKNSLKIREYEKKMADQKKLIEEMQRKAGQGSMQLQGEVQEEALKELLERSFPFDVIENVAKGARGADVIQAVRNERQQECGRIVWESKRTKAFSDGWIDKAKADQREHGAALVVIVTEVLPKDVSRFGSHDGVWVCTLPDAGSIAFILREMMLREHAARSAQENKSGKMGLLYDYLVGDEFRQRVETIVEGFTTLKEDIESEKRAMQGIWKKREKQLEKVIGNTIDMYGSIRGIGGKAIQTVKALELPAPTEGDEV